MLNDWGCDTSIDNLVNKLSALTQNMDSMSLEISAMQQTLSMSALATIAVQAAPAPVPPAGQLWKVQRESLHSMTLPELKNKQNLLTVLLSAQESKDQWLENAM